MDPRIIVAVFLTLSFVSASAQAPHSFCENSSFALGPETKLAVQEFGLFSDRERTGAHLVLRNESSQPIVRILIYVELLGDKNQHIATLPFYASTKDKNGRANPPFTSGTTQEFDEPLLPSQETALSSTIYLSTARCPVSIKPSRVEVKFADGTDYVSTARNWQLESTVGDAKALHFSNFPGSIPGQELVEITLTAKGGISNVRARTPGRPEVNKWFQSELAKWRFVPAVKSGRAVPSQMTLLFRFHKVFDRDDPTPFDETAFRDGSIVPIDIYPKGDVAQNNQFVFVGGIPFVAPE